MVTGPSLGAVGVLVNASESDSPLVLPSEFSCNVRTFRFNPFQTRVDGKALFLLTPHHCVYMAFTIRLAFKAPTKAAQSMQTKGDLPKHKGLT